MKKLSLILKILLPALIAGAVVYYFYNNREKHNWRENYKAENKDPYGCYLISTLLRSQDGANFNLLEKDGIKYLTKYNRKDQTYIFIGENIFLTDAEQDTLLSFVNKGNHVFIASKQMPVKLFDTIFNISGCHDEVIHAELSQNIDKEARINFYADDLAKDSAYRYSFLVRNEPVEYNWQFIDGSYLCDSAQNLYWISYVGDHYVNCITGSLGNGTITFHTNPVLFTNVVLKDQSHFEYDDRLFSHIPLKEIIWDESSKYPYTAPDDPSSSSPLKYILSQPALRTGWYTLLALAFLFLLFRAKRRINPIPVIEPKVNNSMAFLKTIARLFENASDHKKIADMKMRYFYAFIRDRYNYTTDVIHREDFHILLSSRSGVEKDIIKTIFSEYASIKQMNDISSYRLEDFNKLIHTFYVRCR